MAAPSTNQTDLNFGEEQADVKGQEEVAPEGIGLRSIAQGFAAMGLSDEGRLARQFPVYDALYAYVKSKHQ